MKIGLVGLGRMGGSMVRRLVSRGHGVVAYDLDDGRVSDAVESGAEGVGSLDDLAAALSATRVVWVMVPHGEPTRSAISELLPSLERGDVLIDGGNSHFTDSMAHAKRCAEEGVRFLDVGVSGGVWGLEVGYCMMVGGPRDAFEEVEPVLVDLAPTDGYARVGASGAGHFVKMVHNGIEYAMLEALGEGFECLQASDYDLDLRQVARVWRHGSVIRSWLLDLLDDAFGEEGNRLESIAPWVDDSGTGRWTVDFALEKAVPVPGIAGALFGRFDSRAEGRFAYRTIAALRKQFGGHAVREEGSDSD